MTVTFIKIVTMAINALDKEIIGLEQELALLPKRNVPETYERRARIASYHGYVVTLQSMIKM